MNNFSQNPFHTYPDSIGLYEVSLIVIDNKGCSDTSINFITITDEFNLWIPSSFTPDLDGINDRFCIGYNGVRESTFLFNIYDRFSNLVYATSNIIDLSCENGWDGRHFKTGKDLPMGMYIYEIYVQDIEGWKHQEQGNLFIIR